MAMMESRVDAVMTPIRTSSELYWVANGPDVICVLSPSSARLVAISGISMSGIMFLLLWVSKLRLRFRVVLGVMLRVLFRVGFRLLCLW